MLVAAQNQKGDEGMVARVEVLNNTLWVCCLIIGTQVAGLYRSGGHGLQPACSRACVVVGGGKINFNSAI